MHVDLDVCSPIPSEGLHGHPREEGDDKKIRQLSFNPQTHPLEWLGTSWAGQQLSDNAQTSQ